MPFGRKRVYEVLREFCSDVVNVLRFPVIMGLFAADCVCGFLATLYVGVLFGVVVGVAFFLLINSWFIYFVGKKIREENNEAKIMKEGWEGRDDTGKVVEEYLKLLEKEKKSR